MDCREQTLPCTAEPLKFSQVPWNRVRKILPRPYKGVRMKQTIKYLTLTFILLTAGSATAAEKVSTGVAVGSELPPEIKALLVKEMQAVLAATQTIVEAMVQGQHEIIAEKAQAIHDSFILKQEMSAEDRQVLLDTVPPAFVKKDRAFHELSARLAEAARQKDVVLQQAIFSQMINACVVCHSSHAADRFPDFAGAD